MSDENAKKFIQGHGQIMSNNNLRTLIGSTFAVVSFLLIFIVVSAGVTRHRVTETGTPANWEASIQTDVVDSTQYTNEAMQDTMQEQVVSSDTMSTDELVNAINSLQKHIIETRIEILKCHRVKNDLHAKSGRLSAIEKELEDLLKKQTELVQYTKSLPHDIISNIDRKTGDIGN